MKQNFNINVLSLSWPLIRVGETRFFGQNSSVCLPQAGFATGDAVLVIAWQEEELARFVQRV